eukprot:Awhi_evm1s5926
MSDKSDEKKGYESVESWRLGWRQRRDDIYNAASQVDGEKRKKLLASIEGFDDYSDNSDSFYSNSDSEDDDFSIRKS